MSHLPHPVTAMRLLEERQMDLLAASHHNARAALAERHSPQTRTALPRQEEARAISAFARVRWSARERVRRHPLPSIRQAVASSRIS